MSESLPIHLYVLNLRDVPSERILAVMDALNDRDRDRYAAFLKKEDGMRFLAGRFLLQEFLKQFQLPDTLDRIFLDEYKRPRLRHTSFSISHSEDWVALAAAAGDLSIGLDLEVCVPRTISELLEPFNEEERRYILEEDMLSRFYQAWTKKESALKAIGTGFLEDPLSVDTRSDACLKEGKRYGWHELKIADRVVAHLCHDQSDVEIQWEICSS